MKRTNQTALKSVSCTILAIQDRADRADRADMVAALAALAALAVMEVVLVSLAAPVAVVWSTTQAIQDRAVRAGLEVALAALEDKAIQDRVDKADPEVALVALGVPGHREAASRLLLRNKRCFVFLILTTLENLQFHIVLP